MTPELVSEEEEEEGSASRWVAFAAAAVAAALWARIESSWAATYKFFA